MEVQGINQAINITISLTDATSGINGDMTVISLLQLLPQLGQSGLIKGVIKTFYLATKNPSKISEKLITESKSLNYRYHSKKSITVCLHNSPTCAIKLKDETHCTETELETHCLKIFLSIMLARIDFFGGCFVFLLGCSGLERSVGWLQPSGCILYLCIIQQKSDAYLNRVLLMWSSSNCTPSLS